MKFCKKCLLPETYPKIVLDEDGVCNVCRQYEQKWKDFDAAKSEKKFAKIVKDAERRYGKVVVTVSGGLDSSYAILLMRKKFGVEVVGANFDHGFVSDVAKQNLERIKRILGVNIVTIKPDFDTLYSLYRDFLLATGDFCTPCCQGVVRSGFLVARMHRTKTIVHGGVSGSKVEFNVLGMLKHHYERFMKYGGKNYPLEKLEKIATPPEEAKEFEVISMPQYLRWNEFEIVNTLKRELGWQSLPDGRTRHVDCLVADASDYLLQRKFGFSRRWMIISANIRAGFIDVEEGRDMIKREEGKLLTEPVESMSLLLEKLHLRRSDLYSLPHYVAEPAVKHL